MYNTYYMDASALLPDDWAQLLEELPRLWPLAKGSLTEVRKPCIRPNCPDCARGAKHPAFFFSFTENGKRRCRYVPRELAPVLRQALRNGRRLEKRISRLGPALLESYRRRRDDALERSGKRGR